MGASQGVVLQKTPVPSGRGAERGQELPPDPGLAGFSHQKPRQGNSCLAAAGSGMQSSADETHPAAPQGRAAPTSHPKHPSHPLAPTQAGTESRAGWLFPPHSVFLTLCSTWAQNTFYPLPSYSRLSFSAFFCCYLPPCLPQHPDFCSLKDPTQLRAGAETRGFTTDLFSKQWGAELGVWQCHSMQWHVTITQ